MATATVASIGPSISAPILDLKKSKVDVLKEFVTTKQKDIVKLFTYATGWLSLGLGKSDPVGKKAGEFSAFGTNAKNFLSAIEVPFKAHEVGLAVEELIEKKDGKAARKLFLEKIPALANPLCDSIDLTSKFIPIPAEAMKGVKIASAAATGIGAADSLVTEVQTLHNLPKIDEKRTALSMIMIARNVSYVVLGTISLIGLVFGVAFAPWMFLACLTSGLLFGIGGFFFERLVVNPNGKFNDQRKVADYWHAQNDQRVQESEAQRQQIQTLETEAANLRAQQQQPAQA